MKAILKYPGSKWRIADWIISHFPLHNVYLEPFFGSGAVLFNKPRTMIETVNDINGDIVNLFRVCRTQGEKLAAAIELTLFARQEYTDCYERSPDPLEQARRTLVRYWQSFGSSNCSKNSWKISQVSNAPRCPIQFAQLPEIIKTVAERLREVQIECTDAIELIKRHDSPETLIYCDPPYLLNTRTNGMYKHEMTDEQHEELIELLKGSKAKIILSAYDNELYNSRLKEWYCDEIAARAQMGLKRKEKIYMNFPPQCSLFAYI